MDPEYFNASSVRKPVKLIHYQRVLLVVTKTHQLVLWKSTDDKMVLTFVQVYIVSIGHRKGKNVSCRPGNFMGIYCLCVSKLGYTKIISLSVLDAPKCLACSRQSRNEL